MSKHTTMVDKRCCIICDADKPAIEFSQYKYKTTAGNESTRYDSRCKQCNRERRKKRYNDPEKGIMDRFTSQSWKDRNRDRIKKYNKMRQAKPEHRALKAKSQRIRKARIRAGTDHNDNDIAAIYQEAVNLEKKLSACVECDDPLEMKMHVDHIIPLILGGKHIASNLQVLSAKQNLKKGGRPA